MRTQMTENDYQGHQYKERKIPAKAKFNSRTNTWERLNSRNDMAGQREGKA